MIQKACAWGAGDGGAREREAEVQLDERSQRRQDLPDHRDLRHGKLPCTHRQCAVVTVTFISKCLQSRGQDTESGHFWSTATSELVSPLTNSGSVTFGRAAAYSCEACSCQVHTVFQAVKQRHQVRHRSCDAVYGVWPVPFPSIDPADAAPAGTPGKRCPQTLPDAGRHSSGGAAAEEGAARRFCRATAAGRA